VAVVKRLVCEPDEEDDYSFLYLDYASSIVNEDYQFQASEMNAEAGGERHDSIRW
jgi:hypothetical protein